MGRGRALAATLLLALLALGAALALGLSGGSRRTAQLAEAEAALAAGRLLGEAGALARYAAVLAQDPDHELARQGLARAAQAALAQAEAALERGALAQARVLLAAAAAAGAPPARTGPLRSRLREADPARRELLKAGREALAADGGSLELLRRLAVALAADPGDGELAALWDGLVRRRAERGMAWLGAGDAVAARRDYELLRAVAEHHPATIALGAALLDAEREGLPAGPPLPP